MKKYKILIVEDEISQQNALKEILETHGFDVETAEDGAEGLKKSIEILPNLILLDLILPKLDGISVLKELKKEEKTKDIPVIVLTNLSTGEIINEATSCGCNDYLVKTDYKLEDLIEKVNKYIKK